jgi:hypothetical protein
MREQTIHRALWQHIEARLVPGAFAFHVPNGGARSRIEASIFAGLGVVPGVPDLIVIRNGQTYGLELKADRGRLSSAQAACHARLEAAGATVAVARGLDEAVRQMEAWGLLRGRAA